MERRGREGGRGRRAGPAPGLRASGCRRLAAGWGGAERSEQTPQLPALPAAAMAGEAGRCPAQVRRRRPSRPRPRGAVAAPRRPPAAAWRGRTRRDGAGGAAVSAGDRPGLLQRVSSSLRSALAPEAPHAEVRAGTPEGRAGPQLPELRGFGQDPPSPAACSLWKLRAD